jgi:nitrite reductase/ring-hydroxylating ferredoxin subunit
VKRVSFDKVGELSEVPAGKMKMFKVGEKEYLVANVNGNITLLEIDAHMPMLIFHKVL